MKLAIFVLTMILYAGSAVVTGAFMVWLVGDWARDIVAALIGVWILLWTMVLVLNYQAKPAQGPNLLQGKQLWD